jgi:hypothetical protein
VLALLFFLIERLRFGSGDLPRPTQRAAIEGLRFWAVVAASEGIVWSAVNSGESVARVAIAALGPIVAALIVNNAYAAAHRALAKSSD